jgi:steroid delta-isomerase-like uncharacterized protein
MAAVTFLPLILGCGSSVTRREERNKQLFIQGIEAVNSRNWDALDTQIVVNYVRHCQATTEVQVKSLEDFKAYLKQDAATFPDSRISIDKVVAEGDLVAFYCTYTGTQEGPMGPFPASNRRMTLEFAGVHRVENGKLAETWLTWDNVSALAQLGHFPPADPQNR